MAVKSSKKITATETTNYVDYDDAKIFAQTSKVKSPNQWLKLAKLHSYSGLYPVSPDEHYKEWVSWDSFLGTIKVDKTGFLSYTAAKLFAQQNCLETESDWKYWAKHKKIPSNLPAKPEKVYADDWISWEHFLKTELLPSNSKIESKKVYEYLRSIKSQLFNLDTIELITIIQQAESGIFYDEISQSEGFKKLISAQSEAEKQAAVLDTLAQYNSETEGFTEDVLDFTETAFLPDAAGENDEFLTNKVIRDINCLGEGVARSSFDEEAVAFLRKRKINMLWNQLMDGDLDLEIIRSVDGNDFYNEMRNHFLKEYDELAAWNWKSEIVNDEYTFTYEPNLMQKLFAKRVIENKRYGNWSDVGAGKTLAAIMATKLTHAKNVLIITFNSTTENWKKNIEGAFKNNNVLIKHKTPIFRDNTTNYLILNYEFFQQSSSESVVNNIIERNNIDFVILDEVHLAKQRDEATTSKRRRIIMGMLQKMQEKNPDVYQVSMSATPIINNLYEGKTLLEMLMNEKYDELDTTPSSDNALQIHKHLVINGIRFKPKYDMLINVEHPVVDGYHLLEKLSNLEKTQIIGMETTLLPLKLETIKHSLKKGTIIYTEYVTGMVDPIREFCEALGWKTGLYTGLEKNGLEQFLNGEVDILIGSSPITTGVNGLQEVCDQLIILSLPWTNAGYHQLIGRIYRQGSVFGMIKVIIPKVQILLPDGYMWSWDADRIDRIQFKKTLGDCAVDGIIPSDRILTPDALFSRAKKALDDWIEKMAYEMA